MVRYLESEIDRLKSSLRKINDEKLIIAYESEIHALRDVMFQLETFNRKK